MPPPKGSKRAHKNTPGQQISKGRRLGAMKNKLRKLINSLEFTLHCTGCDEWDCDGKGAFHPKISSKDLERLWAIVEEWIKKGV